MTTWTLSVESLDALPASAAGETATHGEAAAGVLAAARDAVDRATGAPRLTLSINEEPVAVVAVQLRADGRPDRAAALTYLDRIEAALTGDQSEGPLA